MGERFGHYEIMRRLAAGGMAEVLLAKQTSLGGFERLVCLKRILAHLSGQEEFLRMFQDEARIAANLVHPNVAQIYDIDAVDGQFYIAMEYVRGEDLRRVYNQEVALGHAIPKHVAALITMGAAAGLDYAHRQTKLDGSALGIVHRDVSPQNILVTYDGHVKLIDFGVAKAAGKLNQTRAGVLKGKYSYMSPEQASGDPVDGRTDIFALGVTLYEITTGTRLFKRDNELETLHAVIACNVRPPSEIIPAYDTDLENIVLRALAYDVDSRYSTAGEMEHDLERYLLRRGYPTSASSLAGYMQDLFAEKLADEALFGGPPWSEAHTLSRRASSTATSQSEAKIAQSASSPEPLALELGTRVATVNDDPTVVDPAPQAKNDELQAGARAGQTGTGATPTEWRQDALPAEPSIATQGGPAPGFAAGSDVPTQPMPPQPEGAPSVGTPAEAKAGGVLPPAPRRTYRGLVVGTLVIAIVAALGVSATLWRRAQKRHAAPMPMQVASGQLGPTPPLRAPAPPLDAKRQGWVDIDAPVPMAVTLGGRYLGDTPLHDVVLPAGVLRLRLDNPRDGGSVTKTLRLDPGGRAELELGERLGSLDVTGTPWAWMQVGQHPARETPAHLELLEGTYTVVLECPDGRRRTDIVEVSATTIAAVRVNCGP